MMRARRFDLGLLSGVVLTLACMLVAASCTPKDREALAPIVTPAIKAGCVFLRALFKDGTTNDICVTAEDLAPLVSEILAEREERAPEAPPPGPVVAFAIKEGAIPRPAPKRRCAVWVPVESSKDAAADARGVDASPPGSDGGGR